MATRLLLLVLAPVLAWLLAAGAGGEHARGSDLPTWKAALEAPTHPARVADVESLLRTLAARASARRAAPPEPGTAAALHVAHACPAIPRSVCRATELAASGSSARGLTFPYDATAPPARA